MSFAPQRRSHSVEQCSLTPTMLGLTPVSPGAWSNRDSGTSGELHADVSRCGHDTRHRGRHLTPKPQPLITAPPSHTSAQECKRQSHNFECTMDLALPIPTTRSGTVSVQVRGHRKFEKSMHGASRPGYWNMQSDCIRIIPAWTTLCMISETQSKAESDSCCWSHTRMQDGWSREWRRVAPGLSAMLLCVPD